MKCQAVSTDCTNMIEIIITMTMTIKLNKKDDHNKNNTMKQNDSSITIKQSHITK